MALNRKLSAKNNKIRESNNNLLVNLGSNFSKINLIRTNKDFHCKGYKNLLANLGQCKKFQPVLYISLSN